MGLSTVQQRELRNLCNGRIDFEVDMARHCTLRAGGKAAALAQPENGPQAARLIRYCGRQEIAWRAIGRGSNLLVRDAGYPGVLIRFSGRKCRMGNGDQVEVASGCSLAALLAFCRAAGLTGLEFLTGIPGTVGGAIRMNAGAFAGEISQHLAALHVVTLEGTMVWLAPGRWQAEYRRMRLQDMSWAETLLVGAVFALESDTENKGSAIAEQYLRRRRAKGQPSLPSAGSFFKNPKGHYAGRLIEQTGLKGVRVGAAMVSREHANFIVNTGGATATDIITLMQLVQEKVMAFTGIFLEPEVHIL